MQHLYCWKDKIGYPNIKKGCFKSSNLQKLTENRVMCFNHEVVPDYLRTKPEPEVEEKVQSVVQKATGVPSDIAQV